MGEVIRGELPERALRMVREWASIHREELVAGDGAVHDVDLAGLLQLGGVFASIRDDRDVFEAVAVDRAFGSVVWPGDVDLDPDVLRGDHPPASGSALPRRVVQPA